MKTPPRYLLAFFCLLPLFLFGQRGKILKPGTAAVLDPNQDGFVSKTASGFSGTGFEGFYHADEFEIKMFGIPIVGGDTVGDNQVGPACGTTDLTADSLGFPAYGVLDNFGNLIFRFRVAYDNPSVEAYTILVDTDGKIGADDPNDTPENPGFELDITLIKNSSKGIYVFNIDGIDSCPSADFTYSFDTNFQISIADVISCGDPDYFYDFYIPFSALSFYGITTATELRFVAVTNISATCAMGGKISDVGGVNDDDYDGCNTCAFLELASNQCPTAVSKLCGTCEGFSAGVTPKPELNLPLKAGEFQVTGTSVIIGADIFVDVFDAARILKDRDTTVVDASMNWVAVLGNPLQMGDSVTARARALGKCQSGAFSSGTDFTIVVQNQTPVLSGTNTPLTYTENSALLTVASGISVTDSDDTELESATVSIVTNFTAGQDVLSFTPAPGITGSYDPVTGILSLTGTATLTVYQNLLRSISYNNTSEDPTTLSRTVRFIVFDGLGSSSPFDRQINVVSVNDPPVAANDSGTTNEDTPITLGNITANDVDVDGTMNVSTVDLNTSLAGIQNSTSTTQGSWSMNGAGDVTFNPAVNFNGTASINYTVNDNLGATSNVATISIVVNAANDPPVATNDSGTTNEDVAVIISNITANDTDVDGTINAATVDLDPTTAGIQASFSNAQGSWSVNPAADVTYTPALNFNGTTSITYAVNDNLGATSSPATITITVNVVNDAPLAVNDTGSTNEDTPVTLNNVTANDTDVDGTINASTVDLDLLVAGIQNTFTNAQGNWSANSSGDVTFTPASNFNGSAAKAYTVNDNLGATSNQATISITVTAVNDAPTANNDSGTTNEDTPVTLPNITANDTDVDGTVNSATVDLNTSLAGIQSSISTAQGSWSVNASGEVTFTPALNFNGTASITYTVNDNLGATSATASITITVNPVNDAPVAVNDSGTTNEDTPVILLNISFNDTDADGTVNAASVDLNLSVAGIQNAFSNAQGNWSVDASSNLTFSPALNFNGSAAINYTVNDNSGATSGPATITITVSAVNDAPVASNDSGTTFIDTPTTLFEITSNDTDVDGAVDAATVDLDPGAIGIQNNFSDADGSWTVSASGDVAFTPTIGFNGITTIFYTVNDDLGATSNQASISINVSGVNPNPGNIAPVANNDSGSTNEDVAVILLDVTSNDTDADGTIDKTTVDLDLLTTGIQNTFTNSFGTWSANATADVTYTPVLDFVGAATKSYTVNDNLGTTSNPATITVTVLNVNDAPEATDDNGTTDEDTPITLLNITANDTDPDGSVAVGTVDLDLVTGGIQNAFSNVQGNWSVNGSGDVTFTPALNFNGTASISYTVNDNLGATSAAASINILVNAVNDGPVAANDSGITNEDTPITLINVTSNDTDVDGTVAASTVDLDPAAAGVQTTYATAEGDWSADVNGDVSFTPALDYNGIASITYVVNDNDGATSAPATLTITITSVNDAPVAADDSGTTDEDTAIVLTDITANDSDVDGTIDATKVDLDPLTAGIQNTFSVTEGTWSVNGTGDVTFTPAQDYNGTALIDYTVEDDQGATSAFAVISITVNSVNDAPVAADDSGSTNEDVAVTLPNIAANDSDVDGTPDLSTIDIDLLTNGIQNSFSSAQGSWNVNSAGEVTYTPALNFNGTASISYVINDNAGVISAAASITVLVNPVNDDPQANNDTGVTSEDTPLILSNITFNDIDVDGTVNAATVDFDPSTSGIQNSFSGASGNWAVNASGEVTFTPAQDYNGTALQTYQVSDDLGAVSNSATILITISPVSDSPLLVDLNHFTDEDTPFTENILTSSDVDPDTTNLTVGTVPVSMPIKGTIVINEDGSYTYTPNPDLNGPDAVVVQICDNGDPQAECATKSINITITPVNDPPVLANITASTKENTILNGNFFISTDKDPEGTALSINSSPVSGPDNGAIQIDADGSYSYTPAQGFNGQDEVTVQICDSGLPLPSACATKKLTIDVTPTNSLPPDTLYISTQEDTSLVFCFEYVDPDGDQIEQGPLVNVTGGGTLEVFNNVDLCFQFIPALNFNGISQWEFEICDDGLPGLCTTLTIIIDVTPVNDPPVAVRDSIRVLRKVLKDGNVLLNDYDVDGDAMAITPTPVISSMHGQLTLSMDGSFSYVSETTFRGIDSLVYEVCDNVSPPGCSEGTLVIIVEDLPLKVYQGITPNGDGSNDFLRIDGIDYYTNCVVRIFDRYNNLVFAISGYNNEEKVWSGQANKGIGTNELPDGTYFYTVNLGDGSAPVTGFVVLKRN